MKNFKWDATDYERHSESQQLWARELINKLGLKGNESVLDIGCGDGKVTAEIASLLTSGEIVGIDSSSEMISLAQQRYPHNIYNNIRFQVEDARALPFKDKFNVVFSNATLHWVRDHLAVLKGIYTALKQQGVALLQMGGKGNAAAILSVLDDLMKAEKWRSYFEGFTFSYGFYGPTEYKEWIEQIGFKERRVELIPKDMIHQDQAALQGWIRTTWLPYTQRIPKEEQNEFIEQIAEIYLAENPADANGNIHIQMSRLEVEIEKLSNQ